MIKLAKTYDEREALDVKGASIVFAPHNDMTEKNYQYLVTNSKKSASVYRVEWSDGVIQYSAGNFYA